MRAALTAELQSQLKVSEREPSFGDDTAAHALRRPRCREPPARDRTSYTRYCTGTVLYWYRYSTSTGKKTPGGTVPVLYCTGALTGLRREPPPITGTGSCQYNCIGRYLKRSARKFQCPFHTHYETTSSRQTLRRRHLATRAMWSHSRCRRRTSFWESVSRPQGKTASEIPPVCPLALS